MHREQIEDPWSSNTKAASSHFEISWNLEEYKVLMYDHGVNNETFVVNRDVTSHLVICRGEGQVDREPMKLIKILSYMILI